MSGPSNGLSARGRKIVGSLVTVARVLMANAKAKTAIVCATKEAAEATIALMRDWPPEIKSRAIVIVDGDVVPNLEPPPKALRPKLRSV